MIDSEGDVNQDPVTPTPHGGTWNIPEPGEYFVKAGSAWPDWFYRLCTRYLAREMPPPAANTVLTLYRDGSYHLANRKAPQSNR